MYYEDEGMSISPKSSATALKSLTTIGTIPNVTKSFNKSGVDEKDEQQMVPPKWLHN
jgi:hypothetical protein